MNVLLKGWYGQENLGDDLLFYEVMTHLHQRNNITVVGKSSGLEYYRKFFKFTVAKNYSLKKGYLDILKADALVLGGGGVYPQIHNKITDYIDLLLAILLGKKLYVLSIGINPSKGKKERSLWNFIARKSKFISVRDEMSLKLFDEDNKVRMCYDLFFINNEVPTQIPLLENVKKKVALIGLAHPFGQEKVDSDQRIKGRYQALLQEVSIAVKYLIDADFQPVFVPFLLRNDMIFINDVVDILKIRDPLVLKFNTDFEINQINSVYRYADFCLGMRFHSKVLAINNCKNFVGICYDFKSEALLDQVGLSDVGVRYGIKKDSFFGSEIDIEEGGLVKLIDRTIANKVENELKMSEALALIKSGSRENKIVLESLR